MQSNKSQRHIVIKNNILEIRRAPLLITIGIVWVAFLILIVSSDSASTMGIAAFAIVSSPSLFFFFAESKFIHSFTASTDGITITGRFSKRIGSSKDIVQQVPWTQVARVYATDVDGETWPSVTVALNVDSVFGGRSVLFNTKSFEEAQEFVVAATSFRPIAA